MKPSGNCGRSITPGRTARARPYDMWSIHIDIVLWGKIEEDRPGRSSHNRTLGHRMLFAAVARTHFER